jgi:hypothetical protein
LISLADSLDNVWVDDPIAVQREEGATNHIRCLQQCVTGTELLFLNRISYFKLERLAIPEVALDPLSIRPDDKDDFGNARGLKRRDDVLKDGAVRDGNHRFGAAIGQRPQSAPFSRREYDSFH